MNVTHTPATTYINNIKLNNNFTLVVLTGAHAKYIISNTIQSFFLHLHNNVRISYFNANTVLLSKTPFTRNFAFHLTILTRVCLPIHNDHINDFSLSHQEHNENSTYEPNIINRAQPLYHFSSTIIAIRMLQPNMPYNPILFCTIFTFTHHTLLIIYECLFE